MKTTLLLIIAVSVVGCSLTVAPDGSRTWTMNGEQVGKALIVLSQK